LRDLKASRAYKRLRHLGIGSGTESVFSFDSGCSASGWSILSDMTLEDGSVSQIVVLNLPIDLGNEFVVRTLLAIGMGLEELDSDGRTPLVHAAIRRREAICKLLLEKGASVEALKAFTSGMDIKERSGTLDHLIIKAMIGGLRSETVLRLLVIMALGNDDSNGPSSQVNIVINMGYGLALSAIIHLQPRVRWMLMQRVEHPLLLLLSFGFKNQ